MLKTFTLLIISYIFIFVRLFKTKILNWGKGDTFIGFLLEKVSIDFLKLYLNYLPSIVLFITGTNGKTSTTALTTHILLNQGVSVLSNLSGSNLERGLLSSLVLNFPKLLKKEYSLVVFEVDEASVSNVLNKLPSNKDVSVILLNLSRDQLDRYGEVDLLAKSINKSLLNLPNSKLLISSKNKYFKYFKTSHPIKKIKNYQNISKKLKVENSFMELNLPFVLNFISLKKIPFNASLLTPFNLVEGRGSCYKVGSVAISLNLTKNPISFNNNLQELKRLKTKNVAIYMNDFIPDGRDVSWFYDINYKLLKEVLQKKKIYCLGSRSYDFYNLLNILNVESFNAKNISNLLIYAQKYKMKKLTILANYSSTQHCIKVFKANV